MSVSAPTSSQGTPSTRDSYGGASALGLEFLKNYFERAGAEVSVSLVERKQNDAISSDSGPQECVYNLSGDVQILRMNPSLRASLNRLTTIAINKSKRHRFVCQIDINNELSARRALLEVIATDAVAVAEHTHKRAVIEGLSTGERRQVHHHVNQHEGFETLSDGEDEFRYLMVALKT